MRHQESITTRRLCLRPFRIRDARRVYELLQDRQISQNTLSIPYPYKEDMAERWITTHQTIFFEDRGAVFAVCLRDEPLLIGTVSLTVNRARNSAELGYWIGAPFWNQGYCTEAAEALVRYGFDVLRCHRIHARRLESNVPSGRVLEKLGMRREGQRVETVPKTGARRTLILYGLFDQPPEIRQAPQDDCDPPRQKDS